MQTKSKRTHRIAALTTTCFLSSFGLANADCSVRTFVQQISVQDKISSKGVELTEAAAILQQDRFNNHTSRNVDLYDTLDDIYDEKNARLQFHDQAAEVLTDEQSKLVSESSGNIAVTVRHNSCNLTEGFEKTSSVLGIAVSYIGINGLNLSFSPFQAEYGSVHYEEIIASLIRSGTNIEEGDPQDMQIAYGAGSDELTRLGYTVVQLPDSIYCGSLGCEYVLLDSDYAIIANFYAAPGEIYFSNSGGKSEIVAISGDETTQRFSFSARENNSSTVSTETSSSGLNNSEEFDQNDQSNFSSNAVPKSNQQGGAMLENSSNESSVQVDNNVGTTIKIEDRADFQAIISGKWSLGELPCDLNGGAYYEYGMQFSIGESVTTAGKKFQSENRGSAEFFINEDDQVTLRSVQYADGNPFITKLSGSPDTIIAEVVRVFEIVGENIETSSAITVLDLQKLLAGGGIAYKTTYEKSLSYKCSS